jgi:hypothetical protein
MNFMSAEAELAERKRMSAGRRWRRRIEGV